MTPSRSVAEAFSRHLLLQAAWPALAALVFVLAPAVLRIGTGASMLSPWPWGAWTIALAAALAVLALCAMLAFDALLFRLIASYEDDMEGGAAVDDILTRMRLKPAPTTTRTLSDRIAGTQRLLRRQRVALAACLGASLFSLLV